MYMHVHFPRYAYAYIVTERSKAYFLHTKGPDGIKKRHSSSGGARERSSVQRMWQSVHHARYEEE